MSCLKLSRRCDFASRSQYKKLDVIFQFGLGIASSFQIASWHGANIRSIMMPHCVVTCCRPWSLPQHELHQVGEEQASQPWISWPRVPPSQEAIQVAIHFSTPSPSPHPSPPPSQHHVSCSCPAGRTILVWCSRFHPTILVWCSRFHPTILVWCSRLHHRQLCCRLPIVMSSNHLRQVFCCLSMVKPIKSRRLPHLHLLRRGIGNVNINQLRQCWNHSNQ